MRTDEEVELDPAPARPARCWEDVPETWHELWGSIIRMEARGHIEDEIAARRRMAAREGRRWTAEDERLAERYRRRLLSHEPAWWVANRHGLEEALRWR